jgi:hypothetical protein
LTAGGAGLFYGLSGGGQVMRLCWVLLAVVGLGCGPAGALERVVATSAALALALAEAAPGDVVLVAPGVYRGGLARTGLAAVTIRGLGPGPAIIRGGHEGLHLSDARDVTLEDLTFERQSVNGLNIDDGGTFATPSQGIRLRRLVVRDMTAPGNHDGIKLSGVDGLLVEDALVVDWGNGGSAIDMVGVHHGLIQDSRFRHDRIGRQGSAVRAKGGSKAVTIRANLIALRDGVGQAIEAGGATGAPYFRFIDGDSGYEAAEVVVEGNLVFGGHAAFGWIIIDGGIFHLHHV